VNTQLKHREFVCLIMNGCLPSFFSHVQVGIWDASSPASTAEWAKGPIDVSYIYIYTCIYS
jgi:hypothetical protein